MQRIVNNFTGSSHVRIYCEARRFYSNGYEDFHLLGTLYGVVFQKMEIFLTKQFYNRMDGISDNELHDNATNGIYTVLTVKAGESNYLTK
jgi:hypothetical protein